MTGRNPKFINRELSWLEFNQRVLDEAMNPDVPLLERLNFLGITASNLDEFFMVRVGGLQLLAEGNLNRPDDAGLSPSEQLECIASRVRKMAQDQYACFQDMLEPELARRGVTALTPAAMDEHQRRHLERFFMEEIFPVVTPMAVESPDDFPMLLNLGLHVAVRLKPGKDAQKPRFAVIPIGPAVRRFVPAPARGGYAFALVEDVIGMFINNLFPGEPIVESVPFRITRNADLGVREDLAADLLAAMQSVLDKRRRSGCVRLEIRAGASRTLLSFLQ